MALEILSPERAVFYPDSSPITTEEIREKFDAWNAGEEVSSHMEAVGFVMPSEDEKAFLANERTGQHTFKGIRRETVPFWNDTRALGATVTQIALHDMQRSGLQGELDVFVMAGYYGATYRQPEPLHTDDLSKQPSIRWVVAQGAGTTIGTKGRVSRADAPSPGDLSQDIPVGPGKQLELVEFPVGTVQRFMNIADIHAGPKAEGARMLAIATLYLDT